MGKLKADRKIVLVRKKVDFLLILGGLYYLHVLLIKFNQTFCLTIKSFDNFLVFLYIGTKSLRIC